MATLNFNEDMHGTIEFTQPWSCSNFPSHTPLFCSLLLSVKISDLEGFLNDHEQNADICGQIMINQQIYEIKEGFFKLFSSKEGEPLTKYMVYKILFEAEGKTYTLLGEKKMHDSGETLLQLKKGWHATTTMHFTLESGNLISKDLREHEIAHGMVRLHILALLKQLISMQGSGNSCESGRTILKFCASFCGDLWEIYGLKLIQGDEGYHKIPLFSTEGVDIQPEIHTYQTQDGFTLTLSRFCKEPQKDVVVLLHGLSTSSDMFIMPEHYNLVQFLLDHGFKDVWSIDWRGSLRYPYNHMSGLHTLDQIAIFDLPAAFEKIRTNLAAGTKIHVICHCVGSITFQMALFNGLIKDIKSVISNSVSLLPKVSVAAKIKLALAPKIVDLLLPYHTIDPSWGRRKGFGLSKMISRFVSLAHPECENSTCHMLSFMWGIGHPACYEEKNLSIITHDRLHDLFGAVPIDYHRQIARSVRAGKIVSAYPKIFDHALPEDYWSDAQDPCTHFLFITGRNNRVFADSNIIMQQEVQQRFTQSSAELAIFEEYGHQDVFMGENVAADIFPTLLKFLRQNCQ